MSATPGRLLFIVARDRPDLLEHLRRHFAGEPAVEVIVDRRGHAPATPGARGGEERRQRSVARELETLGWALVRRLPPR